MVNVPVFAVRKEKSLSTSSPVSIPDHLKPKDGRFGAGPSKVRPEQLQAIAANSPLLGTSHRQAPVKNLVADIQQNLHSFFQLPDGYEIALGLGGATAFWDSAAFSLVSAKAQHLSFGEFGAKFAQATDKAPFLEASHILTAEPGTLVGAQAEADIDVYAWPHNETSTGVSAPVQRVSDAGPDALMVVDGTSAAGGLDLDVSQTDVYYFSLQKNLGSEGGLWFASFSPAAIERVKAIAASKRWIPDFLSLNTAIDNSRLHQSYNTPSLSTLVLLQNQLQWLNAEGGLSFAASRTAASASIVYRWAENHEHASAFVSNPDERSNVICTIDFDETVDAAALATTLRANGIVDVEPYRKLGRNQLRIATFVNIDPDDVAALVACIDYVLEHTAR